MAVGTYDPSQSMTNQWFYQTQGQDADYQHAALLGRYLQGEGGLNGDVKALAGHVDVDSARSEMNALLARSGQRTDLNKQLSALPEQEGLQEDNLRSQANASMNQGLQTTRQNYNSRGLLYSGVRQGAEAGVANQVASGLSSGLAGTRSDYNNAATSKEAAIAGLGTAAQAQNIAAANQVYETATQNSVARMQAVQQLGAGAGYAAGQLSSTSTKIPGLDQSQNLQQSQLGSQYGTTNYSSALGNYNLNTGGSTP